MNKERRVGRRSVVQNLVKLTPEYDNGMYNIILYLYISNIITTFNSYYIIYIIIQTLIPII